jgi:hypothetical protein
MRHLVTGAVALLIACLLSIPSDPHVAQQATLICQEQPAQIATLTQSAALQFWDVEAEPTC